MNAMYLLGPRIMMADRWGKETLAGGGRDNRQLNDYVKEGPLTKFFQAPDTVYTPRVLKDGSDSVGVMGALNRVYINIGVFSEEWLLHFNALVGGKNLIRVAVARDPRQAVPLSGQWTGDPKDYLGMEVKVSVRSLAKPGLVQLRLRSIFGVTSRAEVIRVLLIDPQREWSLAEIRERVAYTRRQVTADLEMLTLGGVTHRRQLRGSFRYALEDAQGLVAWLGARPRVSIHWAPLFRVMTGLLEIVDGLAAMAWHLTAAELTHKMRSLALELDPLRLRPATPAQADTYAEDTMAWAHELFAALADGDASRLPVDPVSTRPPAH